ncbi:MAG: universal stress protein [Hyphomicrobiales bacterium]|nr:universal stress protein [Hyphomicrobiales bacterium]
MKLATLSLAIVLEGEAEQPGVINFALALAQASGARLNVAVGVPPMIIPYEAPVPEVVLESEAQNEKLHDEAEKLRQRLRTEGERLGVIVETKIFADPYVPLRPYFLNVARLSDITIMEIPQKDAPLQRDMAIDLLMGGGAPLLLVPGTWNDKVPAHILVAWDGSTAATRAVRDAMPLLRAAEMVRVVAVTGEKDISHNANGTDLAAHLTRHGCTVTVDVISLKPGGVAASLMAHAEATGADLLVMGGYGHSRLREFVLGGVTRDFFRWGRLPVLMAH